jgi:hypothetical protein
MYCVLMVFRCAWCRFISAECNLSPLSHRQLAVNVWPDQDNATPVIHTRAVRQVSVHFEYLKNQSRGLDITWKPVRGDLTVLP